MRDAVELGWAVAGVARATGGHDFLPKKTGELELYITKYRAFVGGTDQAGAGAQGFGSVALTVTRGKGGVGQFFQTARFECVGGGESVR
jgi:hypothetical protein